MTVVTKRASAAVVPTDDAPGSFDVILSNGTLDRDGDVLRPEDWVQPLPASIPINANHSSDVSHIVGSGRPFIDEKGNLRVVGTFSTTPLAQELRTLVNESHLQSVSVEFLRHKDGDQVRHELVGGAFVNIPSNPSARVLSSKAFDEDAFERRWSAMMAEIKGHQADDAESKAKALRLRLKALRR